MIWQRCCETSKSNKCCETPKLFYLALNRILLNNGGLWDLHLELARQVCCAKKGRVWVPPIASTQKTSSWRAAILEVAYKTKSPSIVWLPQNPQYGSCVRIHYIVDALISNTGRILHKNCVFYFPLSRLRKLGLQCHSNESIAKVEGIATD